MPWSIAVGLADDLGLYLEAGLPCPNPSRRSRELGRAVASGELAGEIVAHVESLAVLGCRHARVFVGDRHDRFRTDMPWDEQVDATVAVLHELTPRLKDLSIRLAIETHADLTVDELLGLLERLDDEVAGVTLDTGNLAMRLDDPLDAAESAGPVRGGHAYQGRRPGLHAPRALAGRLARSARESCRCPTCSRPCCGHVPSSTLSIELHPRIV